MSNELKEDGDAWCDAQRRQVLDYLSDEGFRSPNVGERSAWHVTPIISVWAIESEERPGWVGWWTVSGDFPTDYTICESNRHPRQALRDIGLRWHDAASKWANGESTGDWGLRDASSERELASLLIKRAKLFLDVAADDRNWEE